ncbi:MAG: hypothetical protein JWN60_320 [Acidobacteria bacterium]|nr:hypothetical protein [Acidobacteriota bacterium]
MFTLVGIHVAEKSLMNIFDLLIIYFACGAPVSVYFYFQNRRLYFKQLWLKTVLSFIFWIPFFVQIIIKSAILHDFSKFIFKKKNKLRKTNAERATIIQKRIENILSESDSNISVYEAREVLERFAGLTNAAADQKPEPFNHEKQLYKVGGGVNQELSARCLHRRNQNHLNFHQTLAERDFLQLIARASDSVFDQAELQRFSLEFAKIVNNSKAQKALAEMFDAKRQRVRKNIVKDLEKDLWMPETRKSPTVNQISTRFQAINRKAKLSVKD